MEVKPKGGDFLRDRSIIHEPSAPQTHAQNGGAERSGGMIKDKKGLCGQEPSFFISYGQKSEGQLLIYTIARLATGQAGRPHMINYTQHQPNSEGFHNRGNSRIRRGAIPIRGTHTSRASICLYGLCSSLDQGRPRAKW
ncbi:Fusaridione A cluster transcription factor fsdR [Fusarium oxysporum f. sp. albedinis]|nr:Fusaridione A cluster transcription factor fsdR [Fusarium oxysporum f. sp. albedinis]